MRVTSSGQWGVASRDLFRAVSCQHCLRLSMAVKAGVPDAVQRVAPFIEDLSTKLPIIQGNQREAIVFQELRSSLPTGQFVELQGPDAAATLDALAAGVAVVAQAYFQLELDGAQWSGYADLLVREDHELFISSQGQVFARPKLSAAEVNAAASAHKYVAWDVKNASGPDPKYQLQVASYHWALEQYGLASAEPLGIVLGFNRGLAFYPVEESRAAFDWARASLSAQLQAASPSSIDVSFIESWHCAQKQVCASVYCEYPKLCRALFYEKDVLGLLPSKSGSHFEWLSEAGFTSVSALANSAAAPKHPKLKPEFSEYYWRVAKLFSQEQQHGPTFEKIGDADLGPFTSQDLFFDVEWFNPVDSDHEFVFMFGVVDAQDHFIAFTAQNAAQERLAFEQFVDYAVAKLAADPAMRIFHFHNPEPLKLSKLAARYDSRIQQVEQLNGRMVDLLEVAKRTILPGSGSYSIKKLERYYQADSQLNRGDLVAGGADAMYQFHLYLEAVKNSDHTAAAAHLQIITDYNRDDCLSTKLLAQWLSEI